MPLVTVAQTPASVLPPLTVLQRSRVRSGLKRLRLKYGTHMPCQHFGLVHDFETFPARYKRALLRTAKGAVRYESVAPDRLVFQHDLSLDNLESVFEHWNRAPLPTLIALPRNLCWIHEGHHRSALMLLAGMPHVLAHVEHSAVERIKP